MTRLKERNWDRPTRRKDYSHIRFSRFPSPCVMSQSVQVMGPTIEDLYRVRENRPVRWKRLRVEKIESRRGHDFSFKIQAPIFLTIREYIVTGRRNN